MVVQGVVVQGVVVQTLIGLKRLSEAKQRLMPDVSPGDRRTLMITMLGAVVGAARDADLGPVALATSEPIAAELGRRFGVVVISDAGLAWNDGLVHALHSIVPGPAAVLYLAGDVPLVTAAELRAFAAAAPAHGVGIGRARDGGTNALLVTPARAMRPLFGEPQSSVVHERAARERGLDVAVVDMIGLALDVDTIDDAWDAGVIARPLSGRGRGPGRG